jgi:CheY-like chemotaxis protein
LLVERADADGQQASSEASRRRIVVADDNLDALNALAMILRMKGHDVTTAIDGADALEKVEAQQPDVALLDIGMPVIDGYEVARRIRGKPWGKKVLLVAVTGWGQDRDRQQAHEAGFDLHFTKPVGADMLEKLITARSGPG